MKIFPYRYLEIDNAFDVLFASLKRIEKGILFTYCYIGHIVYILLYKRYIVKYEYEAR